MMIKIRKLFCMLCAAVLLASCASLAGPRDIELPLSKLQSGLDRRFPISNRAMALFDVELARPRLSLQPERDRVAVSLDASMAPPFLRKSLQGTLAVSGRLYIDQNRMAVMMADPMLEGLQLAGMDRASQQDLTRVANTLLREVMRDMPLYEFRADDLRRAGVQFVPTRITTTARGLVISVAPATSQP